MTKALDISETLVTRGLITREAMIETEELTRKSGERLHVLLTRRGLVDERTMAALLSEELDFPLAEQADFPTQPVNAGGISVPFLRRTRILPIEEDPERLTVAMADPLNDEAIRSLQILIDKLISVRVGIPAEIDRALDRLYRSDPTPPRDPIVTDARLDSGSDAPAIRAAELLIDRAVANDASDLHIEPSEDGLRARYRIDGQLIELGAAPEHYLADMIVSRFKVLANLDIAEKRLPQDGRASLAVQGRPIDIRISTMPTLDGESVVLRLLDQSFAPDDIDALGFSDQAKAALAKVLRSPSGMVLATGPTGSGKTTTLYGAIGRLNHDSRKIITVEDPVEYRLAGVNQIQVAPRIGLGFANLLRSIVRQDPDIIMVGEIRDEETARLAAQASLTGHLVLSSLHTNNAPSGITRLRDMGLEAYLLTASLKAVLAQRLVRRLCPDCAKTRAPTPSDTELLGLTNADRSLLSERIGEPVGCPSCHGTGFRGRLVLAELLIMTPRLRDAVADGAGLDDLRHTMLLDGQTETLLKHGLNRIAAGETSVTEVANCIGATFE